ncbi:MAG: CRISPR-associated protein Cas5 [Planctomycetaceae bacterium]|nr:CRISPR-associated protein Cas5 [Planctomycetaceae bacterium]
MNATISLKVWGEFALFTRPELKVERMSYPFMTPSAARGVLDAILYKPQMRWNIQRITALVPQFPADFPDAAREQPYRLIAIRRNEIQDKISSNNVGTWIKDPSKCKPYFVDSAGRESIQGEHRTQRNTLALHHVAYRIDANPVLTKRANLPRTRPHDEDEPQGEDTEIKYMAMFNRRVAKGQCFHRPYLGCREFACHFAPIDGSEQVLSWNQSLGLMLYDIWFGSDGNNQPGFFDANICNGTLHCNAMGPGPNGDAPIKIYGWNYEEAYA